MLPLCQACNQHYVDLFSRTHCLASKLFLLHLPPPASIWNCLKIKADRKKTDLGTDLKLQTSAIQVWPSLAKGNAVIWGGESVDHSWHLQVLSASSVCGHGRGSGSGRGWGLGGGVGFWRAAVIVVQCVGEDDFSLLHEIWMWHLHPGANRNAWWKKRNVVHFFSTFFSCCYLTQMNPCV